MVLLKYQTENIAKRSCQSTAPFLFNYLIPFFVTIGMILMDILQEAAGFYRYLTRYQFTFILGRKGEEKKIVLRTLDEHFPHLIGLDKLKDLDFIFTKKKKNLGKSSVLPRIESQDITLDQIEKSSHFTNENFSHSIENRIAYFPKIGTLFEPDIDLNEVYFMFYSKKAYSSIDADYLLRIRINVDTTPCYLNLFIKKDSYQNDPNVEYYFPRSFFPRLNTDYEKGQTKMTLLKKSKVDTDGEEILFVHKNYEKLVIQ